MTYHNLDGLTLVSDLNATTTVGALVPDLVRNTSTAIDTRRQVVSNEAAGTILPAVFLSTAVAVTGS